MILPKAITPVPIISRILVILLDMFDKLRPGTS